MYEPPGFRRDELGDIEIIEHEGRLHLFHLCLPSHDRIAHLRSDDGLHWEPCRDALKVGPPGSFDDDMLWTMSVTREGHEFRMLYTALSTRDGGAVQRVGLARSGDLQHWHKHDEPVVMADPNNYQDRPGVSAPWVSWRDPTTFAHGGQQYLALCAQVRTGPLHRRGAVGLVVTEDLRSFMAAPAAYVPRRDFELECPQLFELGGRVYLIASIQNDRSQRWFWADTPQGPFRTPPRNRLLPPGHYAARVFRTQHGLAVCGWLRVAEDSGQPRHVLPTPLLLHQDGEGRLQLRPWPPWAQRERGESRRWEPSQPRWDNASATASAAGLEVAGGQELWTQAEGPTGDFIIRGTLCLRAPVGGLALGVHGDAAWLIELDRGEHRVRLRRSAPAPDARGQPWFRDWVAQEVAVELSDEAHPFELRVARGEVELRLHESVVLQTVIDDARGQTGLWCDSGMVGVLEGRWRDLDCDVG